MTDNAWPLKPLKQVQVNIDGVSRMAEPERAYFDAWSMQQMEDSLKTALESMKVALKDMCRSKDMQSGAVDELDEMIASIEIKHECFRKI